MSFTTKGRSKRKRRNECSINVPALKTDATNATTNQDLSSKLNAAHQATTSPSSSMSTNHSFGLRIPRKKELKTTNTTNPLQQARLIQSDRRKLPYRTKSSSPHVNTTHVTKTEPKLFVPNKQQQQTPPSADFRRPWSKRGKNNMYGRRNDRKRIRASHVDSLANSLLSSASSSSSSSSSSPPPSPSPSPYTSPEHRAAHARLQPSPTTSRETPHVTNHDVIDLCNTEDGNEDATDNDHNDTPSRRQGPTVATTSCSASSSSLVHTKSSPTNHSTDSDKRVNESNSNETLYTTPPSSSQAVHTNTQPPSPEELLNQTFKAGVQKIVSNIKEGATQLAHAVFSPFDKSASDESDPQRHHKKSKRGLQQVPPVGNEASLDACQNEMEEAFVMPTPKKRRIEEINDRQHHPSDAIDTTFPRTRLEPHLHSEIETNEGSPSQSSASVSNRTILQTSQKGQKCPSVCTLDDAGISKSSSSSRMPTCPQQKPSQLRIDIPGKNGNQSRSVQFFSMAASANSPRHNFGIVGITSRDCEGDMSPTFNDRSQSTRVRATLESPTSRETGPFLNTPQGSPTSNDKDYDFPKVPMLRQASSRNNQRNSADSNKDSCQYPPLASHIATNKKDDDDDTTKRRSAKGYKMPNFYISLSRRVSQNQQASDDGGFSSDFSSPETPTRGKDQSLRNDDTPCQSENTVKSSSCSTASQGVYSTLTNIGDLIEDSSRKNDSASIRSIAEAVGHDMLVGNKNRCDRSTSALKPKPLQTRSRGIQFKKHNGKKKSGTKIVPGESFFKDIGASLSRAIAPVHRSPRERCKLTSFSRSTLSRRKSQSDNQVVDLLSSDDEADSPNSTCTNVVDCDLAQIAFGNNVQSKGCRVRFDPGNLSLELIYHTSRRTSNWSKKVVDVMLNSDSLLEVKYFTIDEQVEAAGALVSDEGSKELFSFVAIQVKPDKKLKEQLPQIADQGTDPCAVDFVLEFRSDRNVLDFLESLKCAEALRPLVESSPTLKWEEAKGLAKALIAANEKEAQSRLKSTPKSKRAQNGFIMGRKNDAILLVYPFAGDVEEMESAAKGLKEAGEFNPPESACETKEQLTGKLSGPGQGDNITESSTSKNKNRAHYLTIRVEDYERLDPGEFLNDSLLDFWMQWMIRGVDKATSDVHVFSSHFFSALSDEGPQAVESWTAKKNIDIFTKRMVFIPINQSLHWSLAVLINPGEILNSFEYDDDSKFDEKSMDKGLSCMVFLDSLKAHKKSWVHRHVLKWLNSEWHRLRASEMKSPFSQKTFPAFDPPIPYQDNCWDCGVFVCRYAYGMYKLRRRCAFSFAEAEEGSSGELNRKAPFNNVISQAKEFDFTMDDIRRIREEMRTLIERLSSIFIKWKNSKDDEVRVAKRLDRDESKNELGSSMVAAETESKESKAVEPHETKSEVGKSGREKPLPATVVTTGIGDEEKENTVDSLAVSANEKDDGASTNACVSSQEETKAKPDIVERLREEDKCQPMETESASSIDDPMEMDEAVAMGQAIQDELPMLDSPIEI